MCKGAIRHAASLALVHWNRNRISQACDLTAVFAILVPRPSFLLGPRGGGTGKEGLVHTVRMRQNSQKSWEFGFLRKLSRILSVMNVNYPLYYCLFQPFIYCRCLLVSSFMKTAHVDYFSLGKAPEPLSS